MTNRSLLTDHHGIRAGLCVMLALVLATTGCTGGGGGSSPASGGGGVVTPPPVAGITLTSFSPASASVGQTLTVNGSGFSRVTQARVGSVGASFQVISDTQLTLVVPAGTLNGVIELAGNGSVVQSATPVVIVRLPDVSSVNPTSLRVGQQLVLTGSQLQQVTAVRLNGLTLNVVARTDAQLVLSIPAGAQSGFLTLVFNGAAGEVTQPLPQPITIVSSVTLSGFTPTRGIVGSTVTLSGTGLDQVSTVRFGSSVSTVAPDRTGTQLRLTVPAGAPASGPITLVLNDGSTVVSSSNFEVAETIRVTRLSPANGPANTTVTVEGSGFGEVSSVTLQGTPVVLSSRSATALSFVANASGAVQLQSNSQPAVDAGSFTLNPSPGAQASIRIARVDVAQNTVAEVGATYQRLVPGKPALVRVHVLADTALRSPAVQLTASVGGSLLGTLRLTGPSTLPTTLAATDLTRTFNAALPASWVQPGLSLRVDADAAREVSQGASSTVSPVIGTPTALRLTLVPLTFRDATGNLITGQLPSVSAVRDMLVQRFPLASTNIDIRVRAPYVLNGATTASITGFNWGDALGELAQLTRAEGRPREHFYGFLPWPNFRGGTAGIGYQPGSTAMGLDIRLDGDFGTMTHELGHNMGRPHAPCGVSGESGFPYSDGSLGPTIIFDPLGSTIVDIGRNRYDVMSYCDGLWFSDYAFNQAQLYMERNRATLSAASVRGLSEVPTELIEFSGQLTPSGARLNPVRARFGLAPVAAQGDTTLTLTLANGRTVVVPVTLERLADHLAEPTWSFHATLPNPGTVVGVSMTRAGRVVKLGGATPQVQARLQSAARDAASPVPAGVNWREQNGALWLEWDAQRHPFLGVRHQGSSTTVLAVELRGGKASVPLAGVPAGGIFEFSLSDGLNARRLTVNRSR